MRSLLVAAVLAAGCQHYEQLDPKTVSTLELMGTTGDGRPSRLVCARGALIDVFATTQDGKRHRAGSRDDIHRDEFDPGLIALSASIGTFHDRSWNPPTDALALLNVYHFTITAKLVANPAITGSIELVPDWTCDPPHVLVTGHDGHAGQDGAAGVAQTKGDDGRDGATGGDAPATTIDVGWTARSNGEKLVLIDITTSDGHNDLRALLAPTSTLHVNAAGGAGGTGGAGGAGGATYDGGPRAGNGGDGGDGGDGGSGGAVTVRYEAASPALAKLVTVDASGGASGAGGAAGAAGAGPTDNAALGGAAGNAGSSGRSGHNGPAAVFRGEVGVGDRLGKLMPRSDAKDIAPDGARPYSGDLTLAVSGSAPHTAGAELLSTRTRELHFTMAFSATCKLDFSRPREPKAYHYTLDAPVTCVMPAFEGTIAQATLDLDPPHDTLAIAASAMGTKPAGATKLTYLAKRK